jgi:hypothetical protein
MANPIYAHMQKQMPQSGGNILQQFMRFKNGFSGNAQAQVQQLLNSGKITQAQYDAAVQQARNLQKMLGM